MSKQAPKLAILVLMAAGVGVSVVGARAAEPATPGGALRLVEGRFSQALDAGAGGFLAPADRRLGRFPLTVELWARLSGSDREAVLLSNEARTSGSHWELFAGARTGRLGLRLGGARPAELPIDASLADGRWHQITIILQAERALAYVDGDLRLDEALAPSPRPAQLSGLGIGAAAEDRGPAPVQIDDVRISSIARDVVAVPEAPLIADEHTVALWSFDESEEEYLAKWTPGGETNQRGLPYPHRYAEYEFERDPQWADGRWRETEKGPFVSHSILIPGRATGPKGIAIFLDRAKATAVLFDEERCSAVAGVTGASLDIDELRFGLLRKPTLRGTHQFYVPPVKAWRKRRANDREDLVPLDRADLDYRGLHLRGDRVLLSYDILGGGAVETATEERLDEVVAVARDLQCDGLEESAWLTLAELPSPPILAEAGGCPLATCIDGDVAHGVALIGPEGAGGLTLRNRDVMIAVPDGTRWRGRVLLWSGPKDRLDAFIALVRGRPAGPDLALDGDPGPRRWGEPLVTRGKLADEGGVEPYVIDTITIPYENPHKALFFISGLDFFPDGVAALCTAHGDVWLVRGLDHSLRRVSWQRFATGLYQPLGVKVVDGKVIVLGRDQLTRLHDRDGDGEADDYESFNHDLVITGKDHAFALRLETDSAGNFYFLNSGDLETPHGGSLLRVSPDGERLEVFARGFRHPYGLGIGPDDEITVADNEGNWVPSSKIDLVREGGFYGFLGNAKEAPAGRVPERPLCFIPKVADNSCGGQTWVTSDRWGDYHRGEMLHFSWGRCTLHAVLRDRVGDRWQAATVGFPGLTFLSGSGEGAFHPVDGQLYVVGLDGWQTGSAADGCFQRVRSTGRPVHMPSAFRVHEDGIRVDFNRPLDADVATDPRNYRAERWNYRWSQTYGSFHYSAEQPDRVGHDPVAIESAEVLPGGAGVFLRIPGLKPVDQLHLRTDLRAADGTPLPFDLYGTVNALHGPFRPRPAD